MRNLPPLRVHAGEMSKLEFVNAAGLRLDGRRPTETRRVRCRFGLFPQCDGSAYLEQGNTRVIACVSGPRESGRRGAALHDRASVRCELSKAPFSGTEHKKHKAGDRKAGEIALAVQQCLEAVIQTKLFPHSSIDVQIRIMQDDGGSTAAAVNAASLAVMDAGIPMHDFLVACTAGMLDRTVLLDLNHLESGMGPEVTVAVLPKSGNVALMLMESKAAVEVFEEALRTAVAGCTEIYGLLKSKVTERTQRLVAARGIAAS